MSKPVKYLLSVLIAVVAVSAIAVAFMVAQRPDTDDDEEEAVKTASHVQVQDGATVIRLDAATQAREGLQVAPVKQTSMRAELRGTAVLLAATDIAAARGSYLAVRAKLARDQVDLNLARTQQQRIRTLYQENQNMSLQALQNAEAAYGNAQAQENTDEQDARLQLDSLRQRWGAAVTDWVAADKPPLEAVLAERAFLAQVILPPEQQAEPPARLSLISAGKQIVPATLVSSLPQVSPQIQGISFLYFVPRRSGVAAGMNLAALIPVGRRMRGSIVPAGAVVWWEGKAWAYEQTSATTFTRREVPDGTPLSGGGYFVTASALAPGTKLVTSGAQALLTEEFRAQIQQED